MLILGIDVETTGLDTQNDRVIELGMVLWDTERGGEVLLYNQYVYYADYPKLEQVITDITGITEDDIKRWGILPENAFRRFTTLAQDAEAIVAHNGTNFDRPMLEAEFKRQDMKFPAVPWIDTSVDVPYPAHIKTRKLVHLAAEHGILNTNAHRAYSDVLTMLQLLSKYDIKEVLALSQEENVELEAVTQPPWEDKKPDGEKDTDKARARGYRWNKDRKAWLKTVKQSQLPDEREHGEFPVRILV